MYTREPILGERIGTKDMQNKINVLVIDDSALVRKIPTNELPDCMKSHGTGGRWRLWQNRERPIR